MAILPHEINVTVYRRQIAITKDDGSERLGFFHKWTEANNSDYALIENTTGKLEYIPAFAFRFLPIGDEMLPEELEKTYFEIGILKGGAE